MTDYSPFVSVAPQLAGCAVICMVIVFLVAIYGHRLP